MPLVLVTINHDNPYIRKYGIEAGLAFLLREQVSAVLTCRDPGGELEPDDIEIQFRDRNPKNDVGGDRYDLQIIVFANEFPDRRKNLGERCVVLNHILERTYAHLGIHGYTWILLSPAVFVTF